jgi:hypothetical protein
MLYSPLFSCHAKSVAGSFGLPSARSGEKNSPPIIGATCAIDAKIYKIVDSRFAVSLCVVWNKKFFQISDFSFQLPSLLVKN